MRLSERGFDNRFLRAAVLPDWWQDSLAANPVNRSIAEMAIARHLNFSIAELRNPEAPLTQPSAGDFRLKRRKGATQSQLGPAVLVAQRAARLMVNHMSAPPPFHTKTAHQIRDAILKRKPYVDLASLVACSWEHGIVVIYLHPDRLPGARKFQGLAMFCDNIPVVILASSSDSPPWLAFHLAHEVGHVMLGHVTKNDQPVVDSSLDSKADDPQEREADAFASEVLSGDTMPDFGTYRSFTAQRLHIAARRLEPLHAVEAGVIALMHGYRFDRMPVARNVLKMLGQDAGAHSLISGALADRLNIDEVPESTERFLSGLSLTGTCASAG